MTRPNTDHKAILDQLRRSAIHPFPARMAPEIALEVLATSSGRLRVLDPMVGSGTVLAAAKAFGHSSVGVDIDPLAVLLTRTWLSHIPHSKTRKRAAQVLERARREAAVLRRSKGLLPKASDETRKFLEYWFDRNARVQLASLATAIRRVRDAPIRDALWCGFSRLIIAKQAGASLAMDVSHSRPHRTFSEAPILPFDKFLAAVERVISGCGDSDTLGPASDCLVFEGDARSLPPEVGSVDLVLTSPPYLNAIDYLRCSKFTLVWMGHEIPGLRGVRSRSVGSEVGRPDLREDTEVSQTLKSLSMSPPLSNRYEAILARYVDDMRISIDEVSRVLVPGGRAVYVVGENTIRGTYIPTSRILISLAESRGLHLVERRERELPPNRRYLPPPVSSAPDGMNGRMRREVIMTFRRRSAA